MKRIYIAGPYSGTDIITILDNIRQGIKTGHKLLLNNFAVFCPFLDYQFAFFNLPDSDPSWNMSLTKEQYQANSMEWVKVCDAVFLIGDWTQSKGVQKEIEIANSLNIPLFTEFKKLVEWRDVCENITRQDFKTIKPNDFEKDEE
jgi:hypothetical protein